MNIVCLVLVRGELGKLQHIVKLSWGKLWPKEVFYENPNFNAQFDVKYRDFNFKFCSCVLQIVIQFISNFKFCSKLLK